MNSLVGAGIRKPVQIHKVFQYERGKKEADPKAGRGGCSHETYIMYFHFTDLPEAYHLCFSEPTFFFSFFIGFIFVLAFSGTSIKPNR